MNYLDWLAQFSPDSPWRLLNQAEDFSPLGSSSLPDALFQRSNLAGSYPTRWVLRL